MAIFAALSFYHTTLEATLQSDGKNGKNHSATFALKDEKKNNSVDFLAILEKRREEYAPEHAEHALMHLVDECTK